MKNGREKGLSFFEKYLSFWVALCIIVGIALGKLAPSVPEALSKLTIANVNMPIAVLIWVMIYPMMVKVDFSAIKRCTRARCLRG